jgi:hypothetical protein
MNDTGIFVPHKIHSSGKDDCSIANTDVLTTTKAATILMLTPSTVYKLARAGIIPSSRIGDSYASVEPI